MTSRARRGAGRALALVGLMLMAWPVLATLRAEATARDSIARLLEQRGSHGTAPAVKGLPPRIGEVVGLLEVPRIGLSSVVLEGDDARTLGRAAGHLPDTPLPGRPGNAAIAAHRDTFFRPLRHIRVGDVVRVMTAEADHEYVVRETRVVRPEDVWVLDPTDRPALTLITCYPFGYVGAAPGRFVVRAESQQMTQRS